MIQAITQERWQQAQTAEAQVAEYDLENSRRSTRVIFAYLNIDAVQRGKSIAEIGCGPYPCVSFCSEARAVLYDPLRFEPLAELAKKGDVLWFERAYEDCIPVRVDETWLFNCLQHVRDPEFVVERAKATSKIVRFFEPIDERITEYHPHKFTINDFTRWFGEASRYKGGTELGFHTADCAYGTWRKGT